MMRGATGVAAVAAIGNFLQGWDGGAIAGTRSNVQTEAHTFPLFNHYCFRSTASLEEIFADLVPEIHSEVVDYPYVNIQCKLLFVK